MREKRQYFIIQFRLACFMCTSAALPYCHYCGHSCGNRCDGVKMLSLKGDFFMKIVVVDNPKFWSFFLRKMFKIKKLSLAVKLLIHFLLTMAALFGLFITVTGQITNVRSVVFLMSAAAVVYAIFAATVIIIRIIRGKRKNVEKEYKPMFLDRKKK